MMDLFITGKSVNAQTKRPNAPKRQFAMLTKTLEDIPSLAPASRETLRLRMTESILALKAGDLR